MSKKFDDLIQEEMQKNMHFEEKDKLEVWSKLESELFSTKTKPIKKYPQFRYFLPVAASLVFIVFGSQSEQGSALADKIKSMFESEKAVQMAIEGDDTLTTMSIRHSEAPLTNITASDENMQSIEELSSEFVIYIDEERYKMTDENGISIITPTIPLENQYPEVSMTIKQVRGQKPEDVIMDLANALSSTIGETSDIETVTIPINSLQVRAIGGTDWNSPVVKHYVFDNQKNGSFIITQKYFVEALEGHGVRFDAMLKEFQIVAE